MIQSVQFKLPQLKYPLKNTRRKNKNDKNKTKNYTNFFFFKEQLSHCQ